MYFEFVALKLLSNVYIIYESKTIDILLIIELFTKFPENKMLESARASLELIFNNNLLK